MNYSTGIMLGNDPNRFFWSQHKHMCEEYAEQQEQHTGAGGVFKIKMPVKTDWVNSCQKVARLTHQMTDVRAD